jgi:vesicular inhibitory amino acid transporter
VFYTCVINLTFWV